MRPSNSNENPVNKDQRNSQMTEQNKREIIGLGDENIENKQGVNEKDGAKKDGMKGLEREGGMGTGAEFARAEYEEHNEAWAEEEEVTEDEELEEQEELEEEEEEEISESRFDEDDDEESVKSSKRGQTGTSKTGGTGGSEGINKKSGNGSGKTGMSSNTRYNDHSIH